MSESSYRQWMVESCAQTIEMRYFVSGKMIAVSVLDIGADSVSSVYHYFDPEESRRSLGVYSVLWEIEWCRGRGIKWYYLGYYVRDCDHLNYKANYLPNEIKMDDGWLRTPAR